MSKLMIKEQVIAVMSKLMIKEQAVKAVITLYYPMMSLQTYFTANKSRPSIQLKHKERNRN